MNKYKAQEDLEIRSQHLASFLYILGIEEGQYKNLSIDDIINLIRNVYVYKHTNPLHNIAVQEYIKKQNIILTRGVRRAWFDVQVASFEVQNGN